MPFLAYQEPVLRSDQLKYQGHVSDYTTDVFMMLRDKMIWE